MFCTKCGASLPADAKFCIQCGQPITEQKTAQPFPNQLCTLTIVRANQWFAINPAIKIAIDGSASYEIKNGASLTIPVSMGVHNVAFSCSIRNKIVDVNVTGNMTLHVKFNRLTGGIDVN